MLTSCMGENGCGTLVQTNQIQQSRMSNQSIPDLHRSQMTNIVVPVPGTTNTPTGTGTIASTMPMPGIWTDENDVETIPGQPDPPLNQMSQMNQMNWADQNNQNRSIPGIPDPNPGPTLPENPQFQVPPNPLLPPGYQEMLDYENLQYMNGFLRTQIGKYLRVEQLVTSTQIEDRFGYLVGVGLNYILLQQPGTGNITAIDYYSIKFVYVYYNQESLPM